MNNLLVTKVAKLVSSIDIKLRLNSITPIYVMMMNYYYEYIDFHYYKTFKLPKGN